MSCMDKDLEFHGTKKGGRRKTVSKRRAYVNTPSQIRARLHEIYSSVARGKIELALDEITQLQFDVMFPKTSGSGVIRKKIAELKR